MNENKNRFIANFNEINVINEIDDDSLVDVEVSVGDFVQLKFTNEIVQVKNKPFLLDNHRMSDYSGENIVTKNIVLFNHNNIKKIYDNSEKKTKSM